MRILRAPRPRPRVRPVKPAPDPQATTPGVTDESASPDRLTQILKAVSGVASTLALLGALLYYFGWVRSERQAKAFGADASVFGMSSQELVIRSADVLFIPLLVIVLGIVLALWLHRRLVTAGRDPVRQGHVRQLIAVLRILAAAAFGAAVIWLAVDSPRAEVALPFLFTAGVAAAWYAHELTQRIAEPVVVTPTPLFLALATVLAISTFWMAERVARIGGEARVATIKTDMPGALGAATIFTAERQELSGPGVHETVLGDQDHPVYRYDGVYLLQRSGGAYFFLTDGWATGDGRLIVLPEGTITRLDFGPGR